MKIAIFDPQDDKVSAFRGGGRIMQILKENLPEADFANNINNINPDSTLIIPSWSPFGPLILSRRICDRQFLIIYDVILLKYPTHFPAGIRGNINLWRNKRSLQNFDKLITISNHSKKDIVQYLNIPEEKIEVIYPCLTKNFLPLAV